MAERARRAVVRPISSAMARPCSRPGCPAPAGATLSFRYDTREAWVEPLMPDADPACYDLCLDHAARTTPPHGWSIRDEREDGSAGPAAGEVAPPEAIGGHDTVAVLAAALRSEPAPPDEPAVARVTSQEAPPRPAAPVPAPSDPGIVAREPAAAPRPTPPARQPRPVIAVRPDATAAPSASASASAPAPRPRPSSPSAAPPVVGQTALALEADAEPELSPVLEILQAAAEAPVAEPDVFSETVVVVGEDREVLDAIDEALLEDEDLVAELERIARAVDQLASESADEDLDDVPSGEPPAQLW